MPSPVGRTTMGCCHCWAYSSSLQPTALTFCPEIWLAERQNHSDWEHEDITVCMHSEPGNSQKFWIRSATSAVAVIGIQHRSSHMTGGGPALPLAEPGLSNGKFGVRVLCVIIENTIVQLLTLCIKTPLKLTCKWHTVYRLVTLKHCNRSTARKRPLHTKIGHSTVWTSKNVIVSWLNLFVPLAPRHNCH